MTYFKTFLCLFIFTSSTSLSAQEIEFRAGANYNNFYHFASTASAFSSDYTAALGGHIGLGWPSIKVPTKEDQYTTIGIYAHYDYYRGTVRNSNGAQGANYWADVEAEKHIVGLAGYPLNVRVLKDKWRISLGPEFSFLLKDDLLTSTGSNSNTPVKQNVPEAERVFSNTTRAGINAKLAGRLPLGDIGYLVPQYDLSWGLSQEFEEVPGNPKSRLHRITIGWVKNFGK